MSKEKTLDADELRKEIAGLLKDASDEALAKCKDLLAPSKGKDEDDPKKDDPKKDDPKKDDPEKGKDEDDPENKGKDEDEPKKDDPKKDEPAKTGDSALTMKKMLAEFAKREDIYKAVEPHVGSFDHADMTANEVAAYAAKKMGIATVDGAEVAIVEAHLKGLGGKKVSAAQDSSASVEEGPSAALTKFLGE